MSFEDGWLSFVIGGTSAADTGVYGSAWCWAQGGGGPGSNQSDSAGTAKAKKGNQGTEGKELYIDHVMIL